VLLILWQASDKARESNNRVSPTFVNPPQSGALPDFLATGKSVI
jgi:hypothetical protein